MSEFEKYARRHCGISSLKLHDFQSVSAAYVSPTIIEERQLNVAAMDVFSGSLNLVMHWILLPAIMSFVFLRSTYCVIV